MRIYGLVGWPLGHSWSAKRFNARFMAEGSREWYMNFPMPGLEALRPTIECNPAIAGLNVTIPYKEAVIPLLDALSDEARAIGAVNVIQVQRTPEGACILTGHNTDAQGFEDTLVMALDRRTDVKSALVLGTGGASKAVDYVLKKHGIEPLHVSRTPRPESGFVSYSDLDAKTIGKHLLVVNATPVGMYPNIDAMPPLPVDAISGNHILIDLIYNPEETRLMHEFRQRGAQAVGGLMMLESQARHAYNIWTEQS